ncbi:hypothetical protein CTAYLR_003725 [Chrysophaeum taylorii]|uniref:Major facilitator superfamily (MFS) profile domain-containing protein n=1 Tax=Chrysophaeum taylorii TaxID=2483200 RepID=A0AAD7UN29_9STRA|nr:hypothetical protein CTAYLR_003725 [Chrysophaeum taylorii]
MRVLFVISTVFNIGFCIQIVAEPALVISMTGGRTSGAARITALGHCLYFGLQFLCTGFWGKLSDRRGRKVVLLVSFCSDIVARCVLAALPSPAAFLFVSAFAGAFNAVLAALHAAATDVCEDRERLAHNFGLFGVAIGIAFVVGPGLGGFLFSINRRVPLLASAGCSTVALVLAVMMPETLSRVPQKESVLPDSLHCCLESEASPLRSLVVVTRKSKKLAWYLVPYVLIQVAISVQSIFLLYIMYRFEVSEVFIGAYLSVVGLSIAGWQGLGVRRLVPRVVSQRRGVTLGCVGLAFFFLTTALVPSAPMLYLSILTIPAHGLLDPCVRAVLANCLDDDDDADDPVQGSLNGATFAVRSAAQMASYPFAWLFAAGKKTFGPGGAALPFYVAALLGVLALFLFNVADDNDDKNEDAFRRYTGAKHLLGPTTPFAAARGLELQAYRRDDDEDDQDDVNNPVHHHRNNQNLVATLRSSQSGTAFV